jgi:hypothetical protein
MSPTSPRPSEVLPKCEIDTSLERVTVGDFAFPLGVYPVETMAPKPGYAVEFEPADGDDDEVEEWPDRYVFEAVISAQRMPQLFRSMLALLPAKIFPIFDVIGYDAYREIDPYISYELLGLDRYLDTIRRFGGMFFEDGWCGIGAMSDSPFLYVFLDEHKVLTVRCTDQHREQVEAVFKAFDLSPVDQPAAADNAAHEHRSVVYAPEHRMDLMSFDDICDALREEWKLVLNVDPDRNIDDEGQDLGVTGWRCQLVMHFTTEPTTLYAEVILEAGSLNEADHLAQQAAERMLEEIDRVCEDARMLQADRLTAEDTQQLASKARAGSAGEFVSQRKTQQTGGVLFARWMN